MQYQLVDHRTHQHARLRPVIIVCNVNRCLMWSVAKVTHRAEGSAGYLLKGDFTDPTTTRIYQEGDHCPILIPPIAYYG